MNRYGIATDDLDHVRLLRHWRWLVPSSWAVLFGTALGDLFLEDAGGAVHWLDVGSIELTPAAPSRSALAEAWEDEEQRNCWFGPGLVDAIEAQGPTRGASECFSYVMLPALGGEYEPSNFRVRSLYDHLEGWGPICEKIVSPPPATRVQLRTTD
jgi:hypothetical protein